MTQEYTPVQWEDETPTTPGTLINKARLDQMQTAHHYADGFEEVDAVPTADPGVDYHKVVFCTADTTFYRWDGSAWVKDVDDTTKALLEAHEADHANPHVVTKAQVGLGNCDNTSDLDKPVSTATQTALDGKVAIIPVTSGVKFYSQSSGGTSLYQGTSSPVTGITSVPMRDSSGRIKTAAPSANDDAANKKYVDDADALKLNSSALVSAWQGTPDNDHIPTEKLVKDSLGDGSVTKIGTANVGTDTKPIKLVGGVPTAVTNDLVDVASAQTISGKKTHTAAIVEKAGYEVAIDGLGNRGSYGPELASSYINIHNGSASNPHSNFVYYEHNGTGRALAWRLYNASNGWQEMTLNAETGGVNYATSPDRGYNAANIHDVATINTLDAYAPMVRTTNAQTIAGVKTLTDAPIIYGDGLDYQSIALKNKKFTTVATDMTGGTNTSLMFTADNNGVLARLRYRSGQNKMRALYADLYKADGTALVTTLIEYDGVNDILSVPVHTTGNETIAGVKTLTDTPVISSSAHTGLIMTTSRTSGNLDTIYFKDGNDAVIADITTVSGGFMDLRSPSDSSGAVRAPYQRAYNASNTTDVATIGTLDAYTPMVRTTDNQDIAGTKRYTNALFGTSFKSTEVVATGSGTKYWKVGIIPNLATRRYFGFRGLIGRGSILSIFGVGGQYYSSAYTISMNILSNFTISTPQAEIGMASIDNQECIVIKTLRQTTVSMTILDCISGASDTPTDITFVTPEEVTQPANFVSVGAIA